jgi:hypothetical protein
MPCGEGRTRKRAEMERGQCADSADQEKGENGGRAQAFTYLLGMDLAYRTHGHQFV